MRKGLFKKRPFDFMIRLPNPPSRTPLSDEACELFHARPPPLLDVSAWHDDRVGWSDFIMEHSNEAITVLFGDYFKLTFKKKIGSLHGRYSLLRRTWSFWLLDLPGGRW